MDLNKELQEIKEEIESQDLEEWSRKDPARMAAAKKRSQNANRLEKNMRKVLSDLKELRMEARVFYEGMVPNNNDYKDFVQIWKWVDTSTENLSDTLTKFLEYRKIHLS